MPPAQDVEVEWFALIFCQVRRVTQQDIQGIVHSCFLQGVGEQRLYFHVLLLIKAHSYIFQCNIIEKIISQRFRK